MVEYSDFSYSLVLRNNREGHSFLHSVCFYFVLSPRSTGSPVARILLWGEGAATNLIELITLYHLCHLLQLC